MKNLKKFSASLLLLTLLLSNSDCTRIDKDLQKPKGFDCVVLNQNKALNTIKYFLKTNVDASDENFPLDELYQLAYSLDEKPTCFCVHTMTKEGKEVACNGYQAYSSGRHDQLESWAEEKISELMKLRRKNR